jgi:hypothetical protein
MSLSNLKKFISKSDTNDIFITKSGEKTIVYSYNGNTVCYYESPTDLEVSDVYFPVSDLGDNVLTKQIVKNIKTTKDEAPFIFEFSVEGVEEIQTNKLVKVFSSFSKFYDTESFRTVTSGVHIRQGVLFATDAVVLKLSKLKLLGVASNMVVDVNPVLSFLDINAKKIKSVGKSLFKAKTIKNDTLTLGHITLPEDNSAMWVGTDTVSFVINSLADSSLDFSFIKQFRPFFQLRVHRDKMIAELNNLINLKEEVEIDTMPNMVKFTLSDKLTISLFEYNGEVNHKVVLPYENVSKEEGTFVLDATKLIILLKELDDSSVLIDVTKKKDMCKLKSEDSKDLLALAGTTF